jgi:hypothetical protein
LWAFSAGLRSAAYLSLQMPIPILLCFAALVIACASGCANRTVFVPEESPMRIGPRADVRVYHRVDGVWTLSQNTIRIPEGWYLVPPSYVKGD